jgi:hypothetical protein
MSFSIIWVLISQATAMLHKINVHKFDSIICLKCITFLATFAMTFDPYTSAVAALMAHIFDSQLNNIKL